MMRVTIPKQEFNKIIHSRNLLIGVVILLVIIIFFFILNAVNANKLNWGMKIAGVSVSGLYPNEAEELLETKIQQFLEKEFFLNYKDYFWQANAQKLGLEIDIPATVNSAFNKDNIYWQILSLLRYNQKPIWKIGDEKLESFLQTNLSPVHNPAKNASLIYEEEKNDFVITSSSEGIIVDKNNLKKDLIKILNNLQQNDIKISLIEDKPEVLENETEQAYQEAKTLLEKVPLKLFIIDDKEKTKIDTIDKETLLGLLDFGPDNGILVIKFTEEKIKDYLLSLAPMINREPVDAKLTIKNGRVTTFSLSQQGIKLEIKENIPILSQGLLRGEKEIELRINIIQPKITTESIDNMGITALLSKGVSNFSGSPNSRIHNIKLGAAKLNGVLIKPDEEFSFNETLGEVGPEQGYLPELVIKRDKTIPEYGGGLCQVSTTTFRAAVNSGLEITQRYPHAFPVKYYNPQGFDATVYPPFPDLRFINNTPNQILIQTKIKDYNLIFEFYGTDDGRKIEIDGPYQYDIKEDGSMKARLTQKVFDKNNNIIIDKTFLSTYKSPNLYPIERNPLE